MRPKLSLAGLNRLRSVIALLSGAMAFGLSVLGRSTTSASAMVDGTLMTTLWIYIGVTAVPWANLKGMAGSGAMPAVTMLGFAAYLGAATAFSGWTVAENPVWREPPRAEAAPRCVPDPGAAPVANRPLSPSPAAALPAPVLPSPAVAPAPTVAVPDASVLAPVPDASVRADAAGDGSVGEPDGRRRRSRRRRSDDEEEESDDSRPPTAVLERDQPGSGAPSN